jgi:hypothetical protein
MDSWQIERNELQAKVSKLTQEGELWKFEKAMLVSALHAAKKEFNHQHEKLKFLQEKLRRTKSSKCTCETPHCHRVVEKHHHHCAVCRTRAERKELEKKGLERKEGNDQSSNHIIMSLGEQLRKQMQLHYDLEEKLRSTKKQLSQSNKKLKTAERDRAVIAEQLAHEQTNSHMMKYDMEYQMSLLHDSLLESSARLEHVTSQLRESCHQKESVQRNLERSMISLQEASVDVVLENSAKALEFKSMKLLQRLMATRLRWGHTVATNSQLLIEN